MDLPHLYRGNVHSSPRALPSPLPQGDICVGLTVMDALSRAFSAGLSSDHNSWGDAPG